jgi:hypothetical protein
MWRPTPRFQHSCTYFVMDFTNGYGLHTLATAHGLAYFCFTLYSSRRMAGSVYPLDRKYHLLRRRNMGLRGIQALSWISTGVQVLGDHRMECVETSARTSNEIGYDCQTKAFRGSNRIPCTPIG